MLLKVRSSGSRQSGWRGRGQSPREFRIGNGGVDISESYRSVEEIMEGRARPRIDPHEELIAKVSAPRTTSKKGRKKK